LSPSPEAHDPALPRFRFEPSADHPGWMTWDLADPARYNAFLGPLLVRLEAEVARVRMLPEARHSNLGDNVHGGALLGFMDVALFAASRAFGLLSAGRAVTLDLSAQFITGGVIGEPLEARIELLRETGRMLFLRGLIVQDTAGTIASFSGTLRKSSAK
jgi:uncharacterized protein (TIGR00369 family)